MTQKDLLEQWNKNRMQLIVAQFAPTFLLITTAGLVPAIRDAGAYTVAAVLGILLASGILGALVEYSAAHEAQAVAKELIAVADNSVTKTIAKTAAWLHVAKYLTPAIFVGIFIALCLALLG